jgi:hypothetical protein
MAKKANIYGKMQPQVRGPRPEAGISKETIAELEKKLNLF